MDQQVFQTIITALLSSGIVAGIFSLLTKKSRSPESENELARLGSDFAAQLLEDARSERKELRLTIIDLEKSNDTKQDTIDRLKALANDKDNRIAELERRQQLVAEKLQHGQSITLVDIFGKEAPNLRVRTQEGVI